VHLAKPGGRATTKRHVSPAENTRRINAKILQPPHGLLLHRPDTGRRPDLPACIIQWVCLLRPLRHLGHRESQASADTTYLPQPRPRLTRTCADDSSLRKPRHTPRSALAARQSVVIPLGIDLAPFEHLPASMPMDPFPQIWTLRVPVRSAEGSRTAARAFTQPDDRSGTKTVLVIAGTGDETIRRC
jgi:hypothetical protein